ncbi:hypothetical protein Avbf_17444 [Armadillidium vulgare]|nr:hypothetical protein Avbf_17444 [Armadillidium vulgare]
MTFPDSGPDLPSPVILIPKISSSYRGRGRRTHYFSDGDVERKSESSGHLEIFLESDSGNSENSESDDDCQSDSSNFRIHVVKHPASSSDEPNGKLGDDAKSKGRRSSFLSRASTKGIASRLLTSTTHVQLYPNEVLKDDTNKLPDLPSMKASFSRLTLQDKDSTSDQTKIKKKYKKSKSLTWVEPSSGNSSLSFRYFDFRRMTRPKTRKRRSRKRSKSLSNSRSRSRSRSRRRLRKPKQKKNRKKVTSSISLEKEKISGESFKENKKKIKKSVSLNIPKHEEMIKSDKTLEIINFNSPSTKGFQKKS